MKPNFQIRQVACSAELQQAARLIYEHHILQGYSVPPPAFLSRQLSGSGATTFVAIRDGQIISTASSYVGATLPIEDSFGPEVARLRRKGLRIGQIDKLASSLQSREEWTVDLALFAEVFFWTARKVQAITAKLDPRTDPFCFKAGGFAALAQDLRFDREFGIPVKALVGNRAEILVSQTMHVAENDRRIIALRKPGAYVSMAA